MSARKVPKKVRKFVAKHEDLEIVEATGKVHCAPTNYDMLPKLEDIKAHLAGSKYVNTACLFFFAVSYTTYHSLCWLAVSCAWCRYQKAKWYSADYSHLEPYLIPSWKNPKTRLFCALTRQCVPVVHPLTLQFMGGYSAAPLHICVFAMIREINKIPHVIERHMAGKKFKRLRIEFDELAAKSKAKQAKRDAWKSKRDKEAAEAVDTLVGCFLSFCKHMHSNG